MSAIDYPSTPQARDPEPTWNFTGCEWADFTQEMKNYLIDQFQHPMTTQIAGCKDLQELQAWNASPIIRDLIGENGSPREYRSVYIDRATNASYYKLGSTLVSKFTRIMMRSAGWRGRLIWIAIEADRTHPILSRLQSTPTDLANNMVKCLRLVAQLMGLDQGAGGTFIAVEGSGRLSERGRPCDQEFTNGLTVDEGAKLNFFHGCLMMLCTDFGNQYQRMNMVRRLLLLLGYKGKFSGEEHDRNWFHTSDFDFDSMFLMLRYNFKLGNTHRGGGFHARDYLSKLKLPVTYTYMGCVRAWGYERSPQIPTPCRARHVQGEKSLYFLPLSSSFACL
jgi:hypothetical protein